MLTEACRGELIKDIKRKISFKYGDYSSTPIIARYFEGHDWNKEMVLIDFLPASRSKFMSMSNMLAPASPNSQYHRFGHILMENCVIRCYAGKHVNNRTLNGRLLAYSFAEKLNNHILRKWDGILFGHNASLEKYEVFPIQDASIFDREKGTMVYIYELSFFIRTLFLWDDIPDEYEGYEDILEKIQVLETENETIANNIK